MKNNLQNPETLFKELDVGKVVSIPSDTEIPVHNNPIQTDRPLCTNFPENATILDRIEAITVITDIADDLEESEETYINNIPQYIQELQAVFNPLDVEECNSDLFEGHKYTVIDNIKDLQKLLSELLMRFDADPKFYTKEDYAFLMAVLYKSLLYIYNKEALSIGKNFSQIARAKGNNIELKHPVAVADTEVDEGDADSTIPSISYLSGQDNAERIAQALSALTQQEYFILDCGSSTQNI